MTAPFAREVPPGEYEVVASIATAPKRSLRQIGRRADSARDEPLIAYLGVMLKDEEPARFEFAKLLPKPDFDRPIDQFAGFGIDLGPAAIVDARDVPQLKAAAQKLEFGKWQNLLRLRNRRTHGLAAILDIPLSPRVRMACSRTGWGDGAYFSYWGLSAGDKPVRLIVDFDVSQIIRIT